MREKEEYSPEEWEASWALFEKEDFLGFKLQTLDQLEGYFENGRARLDDPAKLAILLAAKEQARYRQIMQKHEDYSVFNSVIYNNTLEYAAFFYVLAILAVLILVSPLLVSDRHDKLHHLQYSSALGRRIIGRQLLATLLSAFALTTLLVLLFWAIFAITGSFLFWDCYLANALTLDLFPVFDLTYGQWLVALLALMYVPALAASLCAFMLSRFSGNLITLVMKLLPVFVVFAYLRPVLFGGFFSLTRSQAYNILRLPGAEAYACFAILLIALAAALFVVRRERGVDVG
jgi:hypothetical protein